MASLIKRRGKYYSRVTWYTDTGQRREKQIPLKTDKKSQAVVRNYEVERVEDTIRQGENWSFAWMNEGSKAKLIRRKIFETVGDYIAVKRIDGCRQSTIDLNELALNSLMKIIGHNTPIELVTDSHIDEWKGWSRKQHAANTTNIYLAKIKTFFRYCYKKKYINQELDIVMVKADNKPPMYLSETKLGKLFSYDLIDEHYRKAFLFYTMTGCRLKEPFEGTVCGDWLIITPDIAKSHKTREIELNTITKSILHEMRARFDARIGTTGHGSKSITAKGIIDAYSKEFKKAAVALDFGEHKFHNLRDTFAVRRWIECGDIHLVMKEIGHTSVTMTQKYANFNIRRLITDFTSLEKIIKLKLSKTATNETLVKIGSNSLELN